MNTPFEYFRDNIIRLHEKNINSTKIIVEGIERLQQKGYSDKAIQITMMVCKAKIKHDFDINNTKGKFIIHTGGSSGFNYKYAIRYAFKIIESEIDDVVKRLESQKH
ncbi:hypothetical protein [Niallia taxi]|uniref:Uncharacterized protein n=1 Tax=Niallia taxi TaxID=2499688 RepID=A0A437KDZ8_9BACI|nr:hypothetical protein [Niallia taxi]RVT65299.1 hypothetical protein EM808_07265 [Niallia taxi]